MTQPHPANNIATDTAFVSNSNKRRRYEPILPTISSVQSSNETLSLVYLRERVSDMEAVMEERHLDFLELQKENQDLRRMVETLTERLDNEVLLPSATQANSRDVTLSNSLRTRLRMMKKDGQSWDLGKTFTDEVNQKIAMDLVHYVKGLSSHKSLDEAFIASKIQNLFKNAKEVSKRSPEKGLALQFSRKQHARRGAKLNRRRKQVSRFLAKVEEEFGHDSTALLKLDLMSDEEDIHDEDKIKVGQKVLRPSWRSKKANVFFDQLERMDAIQCGGDRRLYRRVIETVEVPLPDNIDVPAWAII